MGVSINVSSPIAGCFYFNGKLHPMTSSVDFGRSLMLSLRKIPSSTIHISNSIHHFLDSKIIHLQKSSKFPAGKYLDQSLVNSHNYGEWLFIYS